MRPAVKADIGPAVNTARPRILFITHLDIWLLTTERGRRGAGNQSLYNTLLGYAAAGFDVHVLTSSAALTGVDQVGGRITIHRRRLPFLNAWQSLRTWWRRAGGSEARAEGWRAVENPSHGTPVENRRHEPDDRLESRSHMQSRSDMQSQSDTAPDARRLVGEGSVLTTGQSVRFWLSFQLMAMWHGARLARAQRFDAYYGYEVNGAVAAFVLARILRRPCVTRFQGTELAGLVDAPLQLLSRFWTFVLAYWLPADLVVMANDGTQGDRVLRFVRQDRRRCCFWMNGVDKMAVRRGDLDAAAFKRGLGIAEGHALILTTCRLVQWKRIDRALRALAAVRRRTDRFCYIVIGDGPIKADLEHLARELGLADRVRLVGALPHGEVMNFLNACDIYLSTYDLSNLGNPLIEATVCGRCIVTLDNGGTRDLIADGVNGVLLRPDDDAALQDALARLIDDATERKRLGDGALRRAESLATWSQRMEREIAMYSRLTRRTTV